MSNNSNSIEYSIDTEHSIVSSIVYKGIGSIDRIHILSYPTKN
jgi:hypothetical protein